MIGDLPLERLPGGVRQAAKKVQDVFNAIYGYMGRGLFDGAQPQFDILERQLSREQEAGLGEQAFAEVAR